MRLSAPLLLALFLAGCANPAQESASALRARAAFRSTGGGQCAAQKINGTVYVCID
jgi:hypothetical protein